MYIYFFPFTYICAIIIIKEKGAINLSWGRTGTWEGLREISWEGWQGLKRLLM